MAKIPVCPKLPTSVKLSIIFSKQCSQYAEDALLQFVCLCCLAVVGCGAAAGKSKVCWMSYMVYIITGE